MTARAALPPALFCPRRFAAEQEERGRLTHDLEAGADAGLLSDALRITMCAPVRRLQQKTQVFPLDIKASTRSRLTHSLEVGTYAGVICHALAARLPAFGDCLPQARQALVNAAWLHDVGNPPFGHYGESVIRRWLGQAVARPEVAAQVSAEEACDLRVFNGNAQGLRVAHAIQCLNLTLGQYAACLKIPATSAMLKAEGHEDDWCAANAGVYLAEAPLLEAISKAFGGRRRHPFAALLERADDLAYILADLEDAYERALIDRYDILHMCERLEALPQLQSLRPLLGRRKVSAIFIHQPSAALFYLRDVIARSYIEDVTTLIARQWEHFVASGELVTEPPSDGGAGLEVVALLHQFEQRHIYTHQEVEGLELAGGSYLEGLLKLYEPLLDDDSGTFQRELSGAGGDPRLRRLACRITRRLREAYFRNCALKLKSEMYARVRLLADYVAGMTDTYAASEFRLLSGMAAPA